MHHVGFPNECTFLALWMCELSKVKLQLPLYNTSIRIISIFSFLKNNTYPVIYYFKNNLKNLKIKSRNRHHIRQTQTTCNKETITSRRNYFPFAIWAIYLHYEKVAITSQALCSLWVDTVFQEKTIMANPYVNPYIYIYVCESNVHRNLSWCTRMQPYIGYCLARAMQLNSIFNVDFIR